MKSEPETYSIDQLKKDKVTSWEGVRNYQARNFMMKDMQVGDDVIFYHSNATPPGIAGLAKVSSKAHPDPTALNKKSEYFEKRATPENPVWHCVDVKFQKKFSRLIPLQELKENKALAEMLLLRKGSRLSITPVSEAHYKEILKIAEEP